MRKKKNYKTNRKLFRSDKHSWKSLFVWGGEPFCGVEGSLCGGAFCGEASLCGEAVLETKNLVRKEKFLVPLVPGHHELHETNP